MTQENFVEIKLTVYTYVLIMYLIVYSLEKLVR